MVREKRRCLRFLLPEKDNLPKHSLSKPQDRAHKGAEEMGEKLKLYGFNNLTKALSFNIYDVCYAKTPREQRD